MTPADTTLREVEVKFRVHPTFLLPPIAGAASDVAEVSSGRKQELRAVYWDTADLRLAREGITIRYRTGEGNGDGWHLKLPVRDAGIPDASIGSRDEIHQPGADEAVPDALVDLLTVHLRGAVLGPVATLITDRTSYQLCGTDGHAVAELTDDVVEVVNNGRVAARFREIEVEDRDGGPEALAAVSGTLRAAGAVAGEFVPKVVRALGPRATTDPDPPPPGRVTPDDPVQSMVCATLRRYVRVLMARDIDVRRGHDDGVHQMRVSARRLRTALKVYRPYLDQAWADPLRLELGWLADELGGARDAEVMLARLDRALDELPAELVVGSVHDKLRAALGADLEAKAASALDVLHGDRYLILIERLVDAAWDPLTLEGATAPVREAVPEVLTHTWDRLAKRAGRLSRPEATDEDWHKARIAAKQVRYTFEAAAVVYGKPARRVAAHAEDVQELLGEHQDAAVASDVVRTLATSRRAGTAGFTLGLLYAGQQRAIARTRDAFPKLWKRASRPSDRAWLRG